MGTVRIVHPDVVDDNGDRVPGEVASLDAFAQVWEPRGWVLAPPEAALDPALVPEPAAEKPPSRRTRNPAATDQPPPDAATDSED